MGCKEERVSKAYLALRIVRHRNGSTAGHGYGCGVRLSSLRGVDLTGEWALLVGERILSFFLFLFCMLHEAPARELMGIDLFEVDRMECGVKLILKSSCLFLSCFFLPSCATLPSVVFPFF